MKPPLAQVIRLINQRWPRLKSPAVDQPVFVLASCWRSGSTLLQRMLVHRCRIWGEPFGDLGLIDSLTDPLRCFTDTWPPNSVFADSASWPADLSTQWVANFYPAVEHLLGAHVAFFQRLFAASVTPRWFSRWRARPRWGFKEVRLGIDHAAYLKWLFPRAKFLFLIRNPYECWHSYRRAGDVWARVWPDDPMDSPERFGCHWTDLTSGFVTRGHEVGGMLLRYEHLVADAFDPRPINDYLGFKLNLNARKLHIGVSSAGFEVPLGETARFHRVVSNLATSMGYRPLPDLAWRGSTVPGAGMKPQHSYQASLSREGDSA